MISPGDWTWSGTSFEIEMSGLSLTHIEYSLRILIYFSSSLLMMSYAWPMYFEAFSESLLIFKPTGGSFDRYPPQTYPLSVFAYSPSVS